MSERGGVAVAGVGGHDRWCGNAPGQGLVNAFQDERKYPILLTLVAQSAVDLLDEVVTLFDHAVSARESRAKVKTDAALTERGEVRQALLEMILPVLADPGIPDERGRWRVARADRHGLFV